MPEHHVGSCNALPAVGTWENITPAQLGAQNWCVPGGACGANQKGTYGTNAFVLDPNNSGTIYLGTSSLGIWKTTDCGGSWVHINTGTSAKEVDAGRNWSIVIDPTNSQTLYTVTGYAGSGFYKTTNGGKDWQQMFPAELLATFPGQGIEKLSMDPTNSAHLTATFHNPCTKSPMGGGDWACLAETKDGGKTFTLTNSAQNWSEGDGQTMVDDKTWFFSTGGGQIFRTTNAGAKWDLVYNGFATGNYNPAAASTPRRTAASIRVAAGAWCIPPTEPRGKSYPMPRKWVDRTAAARLSMTGRRCTSRWDCLPTTRRAKIGSTPLRRAPRKRGPR